MIGTAVSKAITRNPVRESNPERKCASQPVTAVLSKTVRRAHAYVVAVIPSIDLTIVDIYRVPSYAISEVKSDISGPPSDLQVTHQMENLTMPRTTDYHTSAISKLSTSISHVEGIR